MKFLRTSLAALATMACVAWPSHAAIVVSFSPSSQTVASGAPVSVDVQVSGLGTEVVSALDFNIFFDASILTTTSVVFNEADLGGTVSADPFDPIAEWFGDADTTTAGEIKVSLSSWLTVDDEIADIQTDDTFTLFTLNFAANNVDGATNLYFGASPLFDRNLVGRDALTLDAVYGQACVAVGTGSCDNNVPEPGSVALALAALGAAGLARRRPKVVKAV